MNQVPPTASEAYNPDFELAMKQLHGEIRAAIGDREDADDITDRVMRTVRPGYSGLWSSCEYHTDVAASWRKEAERLGGMAREVRELDALAFTSGLSSTLADDGNATDRIATALKLAGAVLTPGCGQLDWCEACYRHVPHGRLHPARAAVADQLNGGNR